MSPRELISIIPLVLALSTRVTLLLQLNGVLLTWKIQQMRQDTATEAAKRSFSHARLKHNSSRSTGLECSYMSPANRYPGRRAGPRSRFTGLARFSYEHIGIFTKETVGGPRDFDHGVHMNFRSAHVPVSPGKVSQVPRSHLSLGMLSSVNKATSFAFRGCSSLLHLHGTLCQTLEIFS